MSIVLLLLSLVATQAPAQAPAQKPAPGTVIVQGTVIDASTHAPLADAQVVLVELGRTARTDAKGKFQFRDVTPGLHLLTVSTIGYIFVRRNLQAAPDVVFDLTIPLAEGTGAYQETVTVTASDTARRDVGVSSQNELGSAQLAALRGVAGDDPMRAVQVLPGVVTGDEFQAQFSVRGSAFRQTGVVIDGVATPLLLNEVRGRNDTGSIAMINSDILERATLLSGARPQRDGEWLGATIAFDVREGSRDRAQFRGAASGTSASTVLEGPIGTKHKGSWLFSARKSYLGWLIQKIDPLIDSTVNFSDAQAKAVYDLTPHHQIQFLAIAGQASYEQLQQVSQSNGLSHASSKGGVASVAWRYASGPALVTQRVSFSSSNFLNTGLQGQNLGNGTERQVTWRADASWFLDADWRLEGGGQITAERQSESLRQFTLVKNLATESLAASFADTTTDRAAWGQIVRRTKTSGISAGVRYTNDRRTGWNRALPWLLGERTFGPVTLRAGAGRSAQLPTLDLEHSAPTPLLAEQAVSADAGLEHRVTPGIRWSITAFGRNETDGLRRIYEDQTLNGKRVPSSPFPLFASTLEGWSRGFEVMIARRATRGLTGWLAYTYAHTHYRDTITGERFDGDFDQRHTFNMFVQERLSYRTAINAKLRIGSNVPIAGYFAGTVDNLVLSNVRNQVRLPMYARLDLRADRTFTFNRRRLTLFAEIVNVLGRKNLRQASGSISSSTLAAINFTQREVPFVPSVGMVIEF